MIVYAFFFFIKLNYVSLNLFKKIIAFLALPKDERPRHVKILILEKLPLDNYHLLKYLIQFLSKVSSF